MVDIRHNIYFTVSCSGSLSMAGELVASLAQYNTVMTKLIALRILFS